MSPARPLAAAGTIVLLLALPACGKPKGSQVDALDRELVGNAADDQRDPAVTNALEDQIMVDPALTQQRSAAPPRPGATPAQAPIPATPPPPGGSPAADRGMAKAPPPTAAARPAPGTLGELARQQAPAPGDCVRNFQYSAAWAQRLPAAVPLYPDAQVQEAAGNDAPGCAMRVVSFVSGAKVDALVNFYYTHARRAGFAAEHQLSGADHIVAGERGGGAFYATFHAQAGGGTQVDLVVNDVP